MEEQDVGLMPDIYVTSPFGPFNTDPDAVTVLHRVIFTICIRINNKASSKALFEKQKQNLIHPTSPLILKI